MLIQAATPALVLRVPMVLGEGDYASAALGRRARKSWNVLLRGASYEQPIYADDVTHAIVAGMRADGLDNDGDGSIDVRSIYRDGKLLRREFSSPEVATGTAGGALLN